MTDKRLKKILALLAQAEGTNVPEEAKTFSAKAQELMTAWQIDEAQLAAAAAASGARVREIPSDERVWLPGTMYKASTVEVWDAALRANSVKLVLVAGSQFYENWRKEGYTSPYIRGTWLHLFGFEHNITLAKMLAASLLIQMEREFQSEQVQAIMRLEARTGPGRVQWKNGFIFGFARAVDHKLIMAKRTATQAAGPGTELVLAHRDEAVDKAVEAYYPKLDKSSTSAGQGWDSSRSLGRAAGARANVDSGSGIGRSSMKEIQ